MRTPFMPTGTQPMLDLVLVLVLLVMVRKDVEGPG